jgi:hypothetical protein
MIESKESRLQALIVTRNRSVTAECAAAFAELSVDWIMLEELSHAVRCIADERFDFVVLDLDSADGSSLLSQTFESGKALQSVFFAITAGQPDSELLSHCYKHGVFYPVRPGSVRYDIYRSLPLAERLSLLHCENQEQSSNSDEPGITIREISSSSTSSALLSELKVTASYAARLLFALIVSMVRMNHSLTIPGQERIASVLSSIATMWFVEEITTNYRGIAFVSPPSAGPTYLLALSLLLWLCAKQRRVSQASATRDVVGSD